MIISRALDLPVEAIHSSAKASALLTQQPHRTSDQHPMRTKEGDLANMKWLTRNYLSAREWYKGQTMTEYALILSAVAVVVYIGYQTMGGSITTLLTSVDGNL